MSQTNDMPAAPPPAEGVQDAGNTLLTGGLPPAQGVENERGDTPADLQPDKGAQPQGNEGGQAEAEPEDAPDPTTLVPESPDGYDITFAKDVSVDTGLLDAFRPAAHKLGITQGQAQGVADFYAEYMAAASAETSRRQGEALRQAVDGWEAEIKAMPGYANMRADAQRALAQYGSPELFQVVDDTLIGSHPEMFRFMAAVGKALAEPEFRGKGGSTGPLTAEKVLYPNMQ